MQCIDTVGTSVISVVCLEMGRGCTHWLKSIIANGRLVNNYWQNEKSVRELMQVFSLRFPKVPKVSTNQELPSKNEVQRWRWQQGAIILSNAFPKESIQKVFCPRSAAC